ncbi:MAG TPA: sugar transferase, partial [Clostridia bacterium]
MKRSLDIFFSLILLLLLLPLISVISVIIKLTSKGPVLFMQKRVGKNKKEFLIMKFRTMFINTPKDMPTHLLENPDAFITPVGKFLRRTSLDELPQ